MAGGGDIGIYIGAFANDTAATAFFTNRGFTQSRGYLYYDSTLAMMKMWDGSAWVEVGGGGGGASPWTQAGGVIYPTTGTDDLGIGAAGVNGRWFDDGDMVLNGTAMVGGEVLRVVGSARIEDQIGIGGDVAGDALCRVVDTLGNGATLGYRSELVYTDTGKTSFYGYESSISQGGSGAITQVRGFSSTVSVTASSIGTLYGLRTGGSVGSSGSIGTSYGVYCGGLTGLGSALSTASYGVYVAQQGASGTPNAYGIYVASQSGVSTYGIYQAGVSDVNVFMGQIGVNQTTINAKSYVEVLDDEEVATRYAFWAKFEKDAANEKIAFSGVQSTAQVDDGNVLAIHHFQAITTTDGGDITSCAGYSTSIVVGSTDTITTSYGLRIEDSIGNGTITTAYGVDVGKVSAVSASTTAYGIRIRGQYGSTSYGIYLDNQLGSTRYGIYQAGTTDLNYFAGNFGIGVTPDGTAVLKVQEDAASGGGLGGINISLNKTAAGTITTWTPLEIDTAVTSGTVSTVNGILISAPSGAGTITGMRGIRIASLKQGPAAGITPTAISQVGSADENELYGETGIGAGADSGVSQLYVQRDESGTVGAIRAGIHTQLNYNGGGTNIAEFRGVDVDIANKSTTVSEDITKAIAFYANAPTSSGGEIGTAYGLFVEDLLNDSDVQAAWGVYQVGSSLRNYFSGVIGVKRTNPSNDYAIDAGDDININGTVDVIGYYVNGTKVVTSQQSAIVDVGVNVHEAEDYICRQKVNQILAMLRVHGLIA